MDRSTYPLALLLTAALALGTGPAAAAKAPPCSGGIFEVDAAASPLVPGGSAVPDRLVVGDDGAVSIESGCPEILGKLKSSRKGTRLSAKWTARKGLCAGLERKASLKARFDEACGTLTGKFTTKGHKLSFTATRAGIELDGRVPASIFGERLVVGRATGEEMLAADPSWADAFAALGASADGAELATAMPEPGSALDLHAMAWTVPGVDFAQRVADLAATIAARPSSGYTMTERMVGDRTVWELDLPADLTDPVTWYLPDGDNVLVLMARDEPTLIDVIAAQPVSPPSPPVTGVPPAPEEPAPGELPLALRLIRRVTSPVCVGEPAGRVTLEVMALDGYYGVPIPVTFLVTSARIGETTPPVCFGPACAFFYRAPSYDDAGEDLTIQAVAPAGGQAVVSFSFPVRHCLNGTWMDGDRTIDVAQTQDHLTARLVSGEICGESGGNDFTGDFTDGEHFAGEDLKACNPEACVEAGLLEVSVLVPYTAEIASDGQSAEISWLSTQFDVVYDDDGNLTACPPDGTFEPRTFTIERLTFGPSLP
jgi:hypothetical protein